MVGNEYDRGIIDAFGRVCLIICESEFSKRRGVARTDQVSVRGCYSWIDINLIFMSSDCFCQLIK